MTYISQSTHDTFHGPLTSDFDKISKVKIFVQGRILSSISGSKLIFHMRMYLCVTSRNTQVLTSWPLFHGPLQICAFVVHIWHKQVFSWCCSCTFLLFKRMLWFSSVWKNVKDYNIFFCFFQGMALSMGDKINLSQKANKLASQE